jgi:hypothetical protein
MNARMRKSLWLMLPILAFIAGRYYRLDPIHSAPLHSAVARKATETVSLTSALEARSSEGYRRLMDNGRINHNQRLEEWAVTHPAACHAWIMAQDRWHPISINTGSMFWGSDRLLSSLYFAWADRDPRAALEGIGAAKIYANMGQFEILWHLLQKDTLATIPLFHEYAKNQPGYSRSGEVNWAKGDLPAIAQAIVGIPKKWKDVLLPQALSAWASSDPAAALAWLQNEPEPPRDAFSNLISGWAQKDAAGALTYLRQASALEQRQGATPVVSAIGKQDKAAAWQIAMEFQAVETAGVSLLHDWKRAAPIAAAAAVAAVEDPQVRERIWSQLAGSTDWRPAEAAAWSVTMDLSARQDFMTKIVKRWSRDKLNQVTDYLNEAPPEMITPELMNASVEHWSLNSRSAKGNAAAVTWAMALPETHQRQAIASIFHKISTSIDPKELQASIEAVADPTLREVALKSLSATNAAHLRKAK